jgi:uncharacterized heparinase superfamily protein
MNLTRFFHTVKYLKPVQIYGRLWFKLNRPRPNISPAPERKPIKCNWIKPCGKAPSLFSPYRFRFLNQEHELNSVKDWNNPEWEKLWLYNLHYFDYLNENNPPIPPLTKGGKGGFSDEEDGEKKDGIHQQIIERWIDENPPFAGNGWEPYPLSLRIVNWIKWVLDGNGLPDDALHSLAVQVRYLFKKLEFHLLGNHLFANAKALIFAGLFFDGSEAELWLNKGLKILLKQVTEQILDDGGHFELSPMYHSIILEDILDLVNIMRTYGRTPPVICLDSVEKMLYWLKIMCHPDGQIALFNDAAFGIACPPDKLNSYAERLDFKDTDQLPDGVITLDKTGYVRYQSNSAVAFLDVGEIGPDYLPGHAHADTLNFELAVFGQRVIVDSGISCYGTGSDRFRQRGTLAHNTVAINDQDSSEVWGGFRVARRAKPYGLEVRGKTEEVKIVCSHDGYRRLSGQPVHSREWLFKKNKLRIKDTVNGQFKNAAGRIHFHPDLEVISNNSASNGKLNLPSGHIMNWDIKKGAGKIISTTYHPEFGMSQDNKCLEISFSGPETEILLSWE